MARAVRVCVGGLWILLRLRQPPRPARLPGGVWRWGWSGSGRWRLGLRGQWSAGCHAGYCCQRRTGRPISYDARAGCFVVVYPQPPVADNLQTAPLTLSSVRCSASTTPSPKRRSLLGGLGARPAWRLFATQQTTRYTPHRPSIHHPRIQQHRLEHSAPGSFRLSLVPSLSSLSPPSPLEHFNPPCAVMYHQPC